jgi:hypothetical protein
MSEKKLEIVTVGKKKNNPFSLLSTPGDLETTQFVNQPKEVILKLFCVTPSATFSLPEVLKSIFRVGLDFTILAWL